MSAIQFGNTYKTITARGRTFRCIMPTKKYVIGWKFSMKHKFFQYWFVANLEKGRKSWSNIFSWWSGK